MPDPNMKERAHAFRVRHLENGDTAQKEANSWVSAQLHPARYLYGQHIERMKFDIQGIRPDGHLGNNTNHLRFNLSESEKSMEEQAYNLFRETFLKIKQHVPRPNYGQVNWDQAFEYNETLFKDVRLKAQRELREVLQHAPPPGFESVRRSVTPGPGPRRRRDPGPLPAYTAEPAGPLLPAYPEDAAAAPLSPVSSQTVRSLLPVTDVARSSSPVGESQMPTGGHARSQPPRPPSR
jgi:hypothetical protein